MAQSGNRKKRKQRQRSRSEVPVTPVAEGAQATPAASPPDAKGSMSRGYARSRERDDAVRASLKPLRPGERPTAVTVGAIVAALLALANLIALLLGAESGENNKVIGTFLPIPILLLIAYGMWKAKYWAVLGMQTLLGLTIVGTSLAAFIQAQTLRAFIVSILIVVPATTLFWFLVKAMARIQMPPRPGSQPR